LVDTFRPSFVSTLFALVVLSILLNLGVWQLNRAECKELLKMQFEQRYHTIIDISALDDAVQDLRFYSITLTGKFDNQHNILLDNKIVNHKVGYDVITPFYVFGSEKAILINRGWIPIGQSRNVMPHVDPLLGIQTISGILTAFDDGGMQLAADTFDGNWPWRVQKLDINKLSNLTHQDYYHYLVATDQTAVPISNLKPERHIAYAFQWFALAVAFIVMFIILSLKRDKQ
jgi:surfeit locus 1 family protein